MRAEARPEPHLEPPGLTAQQPAAELGAAVDESLAEMAHQLEAALRKPAAKADRSDAREPRTAPMPRPPLRAEHAPAADAAAAAPAPSSAVSPPPTRAARAADPAKPVRAETKQPNPGKSLYDSLEQEMASLLGRPAAKQ